MPQESALGAVTPPNDVARHPRLVLPLALGEETTSLPYLALGMVVGYAREQQTQGLLPGFCIDPILPAGYSGKPLARVYDRVRGEAAPVCLFSSYVWNHSLNLQVAAKLKADNPGALIVFGGPHVPKYEGETEAFLLEHGFIDVAVLGEGEVALVQLLTVLADAEASPDALKGVSGIVFSAGNGTVRTAARTRMKEIAQLPSPYLSAEFEPWFERFQVTVLETNRGCPYGCTYCDWGSATLSKVSRFTPERVIAEIEYLAARESETIFIADANFGMLEQDIEIARGLVEVKSRYGYPRRVMTNFAKNGGRRLMEVISIMHSGGLLPVGIIALQTTDKNVLSAIERDNIKTSSFEKMMHFFNERSIPMASDLMIGLPGQTLDSFAADLQYCFDWRISASANYTSMMPNAPMAERSYRELHAIETDADNMIVSTSSFSASDMADMKRLYTAYLFHVRFGVFKYALIYLQVEHGIAALDFLRCWLNAVLHDDPGLPVSCRLMKEVLSRSVHKDWAMLIWRDNADFLFSTPEIYYQELFQFAEQQYAVSVTEDVRNTLIQAQQAVMPRAGRTYPYSVSLAKDVAGYFSQLNAAANLGEAAGSLVSLADYAPGSLRVHHAAGKIENHHLLQPGSHADAWELESPLRGY